MDNREINQKRNLLEAVKSLDDNLTVGELRAVLKVEIDTYDKSVTKKENKLKSDFKDVYLKKYSVDSTFGKELEVFHIRSIEPNCWNDEYKREYSISGERITFNGINANLRELDSDVYDLMSESDLRSCTVITKELYNGYIEAYKQMYKNFNDIVTPK